MNRKKLLTSFLLLSVLLIVFIALQKNNFSGWFEEYPFPLKEIPRFFDIGVVDANGDNLLDIYTSNHHFRQVMLIADGKGGYRDVFSEWGLDQSHEFPLAEASYLAPELDKPGLYIYWFGAQLFIRTHKIEQIGLSQGSLHVYDPIKIAKNDGFIVNNQQQVIAELQWSKITETVFHFSTDKDAYLRLVPGGQGLPLEFKIDGEIKPEQVYVGRGKVSPKSLDFSLALQDRHAMAWADFNKDGVLDVFINRGALGGSLRAIPEETQKTIEDELLFRDKGGQFSNISYQQGIRKKSCSGRHARWLDFNRDGLLDLYINCYDRRNAYGKFPKQLYIQNEQGNFEDLAEKAGLGMTDQQIARLAWFDVDNDEDIDLVTLENEGFFLYINDNGHVTREPIFQRSPSGGSIGDLGKGNWLYDGKLTVADYDTDGDLDLFASSKRGNFLFVNHKGSFTFVKPASIGLPEKSLNANWVDYDNDGLPDLHTVPQGLFKQSVKHDFSSTGILAIKDEQYRAVVSNWFDLDNDGRLDLLMALKKNPSFKNWWEFGKKSDRATTWPIKTYRNVGVSNHWLQIKLVGAKGNLQAIGARVTVITSNGQQIQEVGSSEGSYFSQGHYRLYFGLGQHEKADRIKIQWPDGQKQELVNVLADRLIVIEQAGMLSKR